MNYDKIQYPWADHLGPDDVIGAACTYDAAPYLPLFTEKHFETGVERIGTLRYFVYDPTEHGYSADKKYPLLFALHGAQGGMHDRVAIDWAGAALYASPEYQEKLGGMYIVCPLANEYIDTEGQLRLAWPESDTPGDPGIYSEEQRKVLEPVLRENPDLLKRFRSGSIYSECLRTLLKTVQEDYPAADPKKTVLFGTSAGGYMAWRLVIDHPEDYAFACIMSGAYLPAESELIRISEAGTHVLVCHAWYDELVHWPIFVAPNLAIYERLPNFDTYFPEFSRNGAKEIIDIPGNPGQQGQHCINNCIQQNLIYDDGTPYDEHFPEGMTGYIRKVLGI